MPCPRLFHILWLMDLGMPPSLAVRSTISDAEMETSVVEAEVHAVSGMLLRERYILREFLERRQGDAATPAQSFPKIGRRVMGKATHLGQGSFGDVWKAYDNQLRKEVAVKIFYVKPKYGVAKYLTWKNANAYEKEELKANAQECKLVKDILSHSSMNRQGASRICACYAEHVLDAKYTDEVTFLVQEMCGNSITNKFLLPHKKSRSTNVKEARRITKQLVEGLAFLQKFEPPIIHHDLKPDNVCINDDGVKIIDWGGMVFGTNRAMYEPACATPLYTPPEADGRGKPAFQRPMHSYDVYAIGLIYMEMLCPGLKANDWYYDRPLTSAKIEHRVKKACPKFASNTQRHIGPDLKLLGRMIDRHASNRPSPMALLDDPVFASPERTKPDSVKPKPSKSYPSFRIGDFVEYWSPTFKEWMAGIIVEVHGGGQTYDINQENGNELRYGAPVERIRMQGLKFKAGDAVEYKSASKNRWLHGKIVRVNKDSFTYDLVYFYRSEQWDGVKIQPNKVRSPAAKVDEANRPKPNAHHSHFNAKPSENIPWRPNIIQPILEEEGEEDTPNANKPSIIKPGNKVVYHKGWEVSVAKVSVYNVHNEVKITVEAKCVDLEDECKYDKIEITNNGFTGNEVKKMTIRGYSDFLPYSAKGTISLSRGDPMTNQPCYAQVFVTTKTGKKVVSEKVHFTAKWN